MSILQPDCDFVQADAAPEDFDFPWEGGPEPPEPDPDDLTDRARVLDQARYYEDRGRGRLLTCVDGLAAAALRDLARSMAFHRHDSARGYVSDPHVGFGPADLDSVRLPSAPSPSPVAEALYTEAAWHLHLDTDAGRLAAWHLLAVAALADEFGSETAADFRDDEAAWREAMREACAEAGAEW